MVQIEFRQFTDEYENEEASIVLYSYEDQTANSPLPVRGDYFSWLEDGKTSVEVKVLGRRFCYDIKNEVVMVTIFVEGPQ